MEDIRPYRGGGGSGGRTPTSPALLIVTANILAFALGAVVTIWMFPGARTAGTPPPAKVVAAADPVIASPVLPAEAVSRPAVAPIIQVPAALPAEVASRSEPSPILQASPVPMPPVQMSVVATLAPRITAPRPTAAPSARLAGGAYVLQLGAFREPGNAARLQAVLRRHGLDSYTVPGDGPAQGLTLVRMGGFADRATAAAAQVRDSAGVAGLVMRAEPA